MIRSFLVVMRQKFLAPHLLVGALILGGTGCGGGSGAPTHTTNPVPQIASLSPNSTAAGEAAFTLIVTGTGFISGSVVRWNRADRTTTFVSSSQLTATISANDIAVSGTFQVTVFNPSPGGGTSNALTFTINNPAPTLSLIAPNSAFAGGGDFTLTATGSQFVSNSVVHWNGSNRATTFVTSTELQAAILASDIAAVGAAQVTVFNPGPGGGTSAPQAFTISLASPTPGVIERVSVANDGTEGNFDSFDSVISADGRFVAFDSRASNLAAGDTNGSRDVFVRDTCVGAPAGCTPSTTRVSVASDGSEGNGISDTPSISADGRFVAFAADASNLVAGDTNGAGDVFVRDTCVGVPAGCTPSTTRVSVASDGTQGNAGSGFPLVVSANGRFIAFSSAASNLVAGDTNGATDMFVRDTCYGAPTGCTPSTARVSVANDGSQGNQIIGSDSRPALSSDGRFVGFDSDANNLVVGDTNAFRDIFVRDTCFGASAGCTPSTTRVSVASDGTQGNGASVVPTISADGRFVVFRSNAGNLVAGDTNGAGDVFVRDTCVGVPAGCTPSTTRVSVASDGTQGNAGVFFDLSISADGRFVAFDSDASNLVAGDTNGAVDVFVRDTCLGAPAGCTPSTIRVSVASDGTQANNSSITGALSADGRFVAIDSNASNLVADDTNGFIDVFLARTGFAAAPATTGAPLPAGTVLTPTEPTSEAFSRLAPFLWSLLLLALVGQLTRGGDGTYRGQFTWPTRAKPISLPLVKLFSLYRTGPGVLEVLTYTRANAQKQRGHEGPLTLGDIPTHQLAKRLVRTRCGSRLH